MDEIELHKLGAERDYERWRRLYHRATTHLDDERGRIINYYARLAYIAQLERRNMGRELNKLQHRIGRQRAANNKMRNTLKEKEAQIDRSYEMRKVERASYEKEIRELREQLARERAARRIWSAGYTESSTSTGFDSTTEHGTGEAPTNRT